MRVSSLSHSLKWPQKETDKMPFFVQSYCCLLSLVNTQLYFFCIGDIIFDSRPLRSTFNFKPISQLDLCIGDFDFAARSEVLYCSYCEFWSSHYVIIGRHDNFASLMFSILNIQHQSCNQANYYLFEVVAIFWELWASVNCMSISAWYIISDHNFKNALINLEQWFLNSHGLC